MSRHPDGALASVEQVPSAHNVVSLLLSVHQEPNYLDCHLSFEASFSMLREGSPAVAGAVAGLWLEHLAL